MPYKAFIGRRPMSAFFKNYLEWGRAVLTLAQSTRNELVKVARLEFQKRTRERKLRKVIGDFVETSSSSVTRHLGCFARCYFSLDNQGIAVLAILGFFKKPTPISTVLPTFS
jgi:hypothetical protein